VAGRALVLRARLMRQKAKPKRPAGPRLLGEGVGGRPPPPPPRPTFSPAASEETPHSPGRAPATPDLTSASIGPGRPRIMASGGEDCPECSASKVDAEARANATSPSSDGLRLGTCRPLYKAWAECIEESKGQAKLCATVLEEFRACHSANQRASATAQAQN
jgi:hypothetical protein